MFSISRWYVAGEFVNHEVKVYLQQLLDMNIIMPSHSPWASNVVLVMKKDNSLRMCVGLG
jgi:hypothetical protein